MSILSEPDLDCSRCPRLVAFRQTNRSNQPGWHNAPVHSLGNTQASLLIMGLAPGLKGANKTGVPFIGDGSGDLLYQTLIEFGFAEGNYKKTSINDVELINCLITNAVRCVPPENRPNSTELNNCRDYLKATLDLMNNLKVILALGKQAHDSVIRALSLKQSQYPFKHRSLHQVSDKFLLLDSYHCSRYNLNTRRLTESMFHDIFRDIKMILSR